MKRLCPILVALSLVVLGCQIAGSPFDAETVAGKGLNGAQARGLCVPPGIGMLTADRAAGFFGAPVLGGTRTVFADALSGSIAGTQKPFVIDVRDAATYAAGHIPGAVNIPLAVLFEPENLAKIPTDGTQVVTACVTGHTASMAMAGLGVLGYNASVLRFGMMGWNASTPMKVYSNSQTPQTMDGLGGATDTVVPETSGQDLKALNIPPGILKQISRNLASFFGAPTLGGTRAIFADVLRNRILASEKLFIIDVRDATSYAAGHIPGAVNMPLAVLFQPENIARIPTDGTPVITACVTGHTASMAMSALGALGFNAYVLRFGMMGWNASTPMKVYSNGQTPQTIYGLGGPLNDGSAP